MKQPMAGLLWLCAIAASLSVCEKSFSSFLVGCLQGTFVLVNSAHGGVVRSGWAGVQLHRHIQPRTFVSCKLKQMQCSKPRVGDVDAQSND